MGRTFIFLGVVQAWLPNKIVDLFTDILLYQTVTEKARKNPQPQIQKRLAEMTINFEKPDCNNNKKNCVG